MDKHCIDINCDMGESSILRPDYNIEQDIALMDHISSVNLACGFHAGDPTTMYTLTEAALEKGIAIGAHPSFPDKENFGRKNMSWKPEWLYDQIIYQLGSLEAFLKIRGARLHHVKPHGALYNMATIDLVMANVVAKAIADFDSSLILYGLSGSYLFDAAKNTGIEFAHEVFADRTYQIDGSLTDRTEKNALITNIEASVEQVKSFCLQHQVKTTEGSSIKVMADTVCIHSDGHNAQEIATAIYNGLRESGISIQAHLASGN